LLLDPGASHLDRLGLSDALNRIERHVAVQEGVLGPNHLRSADVANLGEELKRDLLASTSRHEHVSKRFDMVAFFSHVPDPHGIAFTTFHRARERAPPDRHLNDVLYVLDRETVAADRLPIDVDLQ